MRKIEHLAAEAAARRDELTATIDALEQKLNLPLQARLAAQRMRRSFRDNPIPWAVGAVAATAAAVGAIIVALRGRD